MAKSDGGGLTFTLSKSGTATRVLRYRMPGRRAEATIGNYPDISLADARKEASRLRAMIDAGKDPAAEKRKAKQKARSAKNMRWLADDYKEEVLKHLSASTNRNYKRQLVRIEKE
ncbi:Arm DNA-binding domain-containing protein [Achromobacter xylosoxidans]|uniref:Arm DNA-binding domain-containing protein n=1 Tax=Alcaligenes xylosoxydans xylosoxydans TaxID=85698 RepID=UPI00211AD1CC|nr:Arm DNA-binding domain-containing protein [Achromobacter xylosoxidans]